LGVWGVGLLCFWGLFVGVVFFFGFFGGVFGYPPLPFFGGTTTKEDPNVINVDDPSNLPIGGTCEVVSPFHSNLPENISLLTFSFD